MGFQTKLIHGNWSNDDQTGATNVPVYFSNGYAHKTAKELENIFAGRDIGYIYSRIANPSIEAFEKRMATVEGGVAAIATASGMSAIYLTLMNILQPGDEVIASSGLFGGTYNLLKNLEEFGVSVQFLNELNEETLNTAIGEKTKIVFAEAIGNPKLDVLDVGIVGEVCREKEVIFVVDSTISTPYLIKPLEYGADVVIHSTSKFINGTSNAIGGVIIDGGSKKFQSTRFPNYKEFAKRFRQFAFSAKLRNGIGKDIGASLSPMNAFLNLTGIETLQLRMKEHCKNALSLAEFLENHPKIQGVNYPGLKSSKYHKIAIKYYERGMGSILTCRLEEKEKAFMFIDGLKLISNVVNIGDSKSLVIHPASTIYIGNTKEEKEQMGIYEDLIRISVGIEDLQDILQDVEQALEKI